MEATELIKALQDLVEEYGDREVLDFDSTEPVHVFISEDDLASPGDRAPIYIEPDGYRE